MRPPKYYFDLTAERKCEARKEARFGRDGRVVAAPDHLAIPHHHHRAQHRARLHRGKEDASAVIQTSIKRGGAMPAIHRGGLEPDGGGQEPVPVWTRLT
jgi:hypothetical protein